LLFDHFDEAARSVRGTLVLLVRGRKCCGRNFCGFWVKRRSL